MGEPPRVCVGRRPVLGQGRESTDTWRKLDLHASACGAVAGIVRMLASKVGRNGVDVVDDLVGGESMA